MLGAAFALRAIGDAGPHAVAWLSPLGWAQAIRPFADERWWLLLALLALAALLTVAADAARRPPRPRRRHPPAAPGPRARRAAHPAQLAWRLQRGALAGWAAGFAIVGAAFGSIAKDVGDVIGDSPDVLDALKRLGGTDSLGRRLPRGDVRHPRADRRGLRRPGRAAPARRGDRRPRRAAAGHRGLAHALGAQPRRIALAGTALLMATAGLTAGVAHAAQTGDAGQIPRLLGAALAQVPAAWVLAGVALALFGLAPRATTAAWAALALCLALAELGPVLELSQHVIDLSPFAHSPQLPGGAFSAAPLTLAVIAAALGALGLAGLRRRDLAP